MNKFIKLSLLLGIFSFHSLSPSLAMEKQKEEDKDSIKLTPKKVLDTTSSFFTGKDVNVKSADITNFQKNTSGGKLPRKKSMWHVIGWK